MIIRLVLKDCRGRLLDVRQQPLKKGTQISVMFRRRWLRDMLQMFHDKPGASLVVTKLSDEGRETQP